jgi:predicted metalloprotease
VLPTGDRRRATPVRIALALLAVGLLLAGCDLPFMSGAQEQPFDPRPIGPIATVQGGHDTPDDRFMAGLVARIEGFWRVRYPVDFHGPWRNLHGFVAADPKAAQPPPCLQHAADLADQALYCPRLDIVVWDRTGLIPRLRRGYGDGSALVALAHEIGHAVQARNGIDIVTQVTEPDRYPTILLEGMADCFAGVVARAAGSPDMPGPALSGPDLDRAMRALLTFRDPVGAAAGSGAHGDGFDRASAFVDGYRNGGQRCAAMTLDNQVFTQRQFTSLSDAASGGDLKLSELLASVVPDAQGWFGTLVTQRGRQWRVPPKLAAGCAGGGGQGPVRYCGGTGGVAVSTGELRKVHDELGDYASGELVASRYALAVLDALGRPTRGPEAGRAAVCLSGAYTRTLFDRGNQGFALSPGDLDEAVDELLAQDFAARDATGQAPAGDLGFTRIEQFRSGVLGGPSACGI